MSTQESPVRSFRRVIGEVGAAVAARPGRPLRQRLRLPLMLAGPLVVLIAASWWYLTSGRYVSTDDAYVQAARTMISADISGRVVAVRRWAASIKELNRQQKQPPAISSVGNPREESMAVSTR